jgi:hypothetical protein
VRKCSAFFYAGLGGFLAEATPRLIVGLFEHEANSLKTIDYDQTTGCLALLLLNGFCRKKIVPQGIIVDGSKEWGLLRELKSF